MPQSNTTSTSPTKLKIVTRISPNNKPAADSPEYHNIYHWDRIIGVAVLLLLSLIAVLYFIISAISNDSVTDKPAEKKHLTEAIASPPAASNNINEKLSDNTASPSPNQTLNKPKESPPLIMDSKTEALISEANTALSSASPSAGATKTQPPIINIHSKDINRAIFSHTLKNKEPNSIIKDTVLLDKGGLSRVYFFTDVKDRAGDTLTHTWYRNGKKIVKVRTPIGSDTWRCSSSKYLDKTMQGDWEVKITDKKGELVASGSFVFITG